MSTKRRIALSLVTLALVTAATVASVTLASAAPEKVFTLKMAPGTVTAGTTATLTATIRNATPNGNSSINSAKVTMSAPPGTVITGVSGAGVPTVTDGGLSVSISGLSPIKPGKSQTFTLTLDVLGASSCAGSTIAWSAQAWTGSSFSGDTFRLTTDPTSADRQTDVNVECELRFIDEPADAIVGDGVITSVDNDPSGDPVRVGMYVGPSLAAWFGGNISLSIGSGSTGTGDLSGGSEDAVNGVATFDLLFIDDAGDYQLEAAGGGLTSDPSATFRISDGILGCDSSNNTAMTDDETVTVTRLENVGGTDCTLLPYILQRDGNEFEFIKNDSLDPDAQFEIEMNSWNAEAAVNPLPATQTGPTLLDLHDIQWCLGTGTDPTILPADEVACLLTQSAEIVGFELVQVTESYYVSRDPSFKR